MRIAVIGAGIAGLTAAWLLDEIHDVVVFEAADRLGGHADTVAIDLDSTTLYADLGAQHLPPTAFPIHRALLGLLDITSSDIVSGPLHMTMQWEGTDQILVTPHTPAEPQRQAATGLPWEALGKFMTDAVQFEKDDGDWTLTLAELCEKAKIGSHWTTTLIQPWLASFVGCSNDQAAGMSARAAISWVTRTPTPAPDQAPCFDGLLQGMQHLAHTLARELTHPVQTATPVDLITTTGQAITVHTKGTQQSFDRVVLALPAPDACRILGAAPGLEHQRRHLAAFSYVPTTITLHRDPAYMAPDRHHWSTNTVTVHDGWAETSTWYGPLQNTQVFKSWTTHRDQPAKVIAARGYEHLMVTPAAIRARQALASRQGEAGVYFAGTYLHDVDSQESAAHSALETARLLTGESPRIRSLLTLAGVSSPGN